MISDLNQRITIERPIRSADGAGGATETWSTLAIVWAKLEPVAANDNVSANALRTRVKHKLTLRRLASAAAGMRATLGARTFAIHGVLDAGAQTPLMTLLCEERP